MGELRKPLLLKKTATEEDKNVYQVTLKVQNEAYRAANQVGIRTLEAKFMALFVTCGSTRQMSVKLHAESD